MGRAWGCGVEAVFFDVPLAVCVDRNARRHRVVPGEALAKMAGKLVPPTTEEGFTRVTVLKEGSPVGP
jgi:predicted kinase